MRKIIILLSVALVLGFSSTVSAATYTVQRGDSLWLISKKLDVPFDEVLRLNAGIADKHLIYPYQKIIVPDVRPSPAPPNSVTNQAQAVLLLVNEERAKQGLKPLSLSTKLTEVANAKSKDMALKGYFSHQSPTYGSPFDMLKSYGISYKSAGENIAAGQKTAQEVMQSWMGSSGHRANILNKSYTELGVGYFAGGSYGTYWTQTFVGR